MQRRKDEPAWVAARRKEKAELQAAIERLQQERAALEQSLPAAPKQKSIYRLLLESLMGGGVAVALITGAFTVLNEDGPDPYQPCDNAYEALMDNELNSGLTEEERREFLQSQLQLASDCARKRP